MCKKQDKWERWNKLMAEEDYIVIVKEFDDMIRKKQNITVGDLIIRDQALEEMGVISLSPNAIYNRKNNNGKTKRRK
jgi:C-terminal processing protease CtpA/Prc